VVIASRNSGKVVELRRLLREVPWRLQELEHVPGSGRIHWEEDGATYRANAMIKARAVCAGTGLTSLADDSGIEIKALGGWPGVHTARWLGAGASAAQLLAGLTERIANLPPADRDATFVCAVALAVPGPRGEIELFESEARLEGSLQAQPRGRQGFGYDPIFVPEGEVRTMAEMSRAQKDELSHRGAAVRQLLLDLARS
jgi:XTP/dITP diphosphohydrolase